ncbi:Vacuolar iron transporter-like 4, partial [Mucuna pruriens]
MKLFFLDHSHKMLPLLQDFVFLKSYFCFDLYSILSSFCRLPNGYVLLFQEPLRGWLVTTESLKMAVGAVQQGIKTTIQSGFVWFAKPFTSSHCPSFSLFCWCNGLGVLLAAVTFALLLFGWLKAVLDKAPVLRCALMVLVGDWMVMIITFGLTMLIGSSGLFSTFPIY